MCVCVNMFLPVDFTAVSFTVELAVDRRAVQCGAVRRDTRPGEEPGEP